MSYLILLSNNNEYFSYSWKASHLVGEGGGIFPFEKILRKQINLSERLSLETNPNCGPYPLPFRRSGGMVSILVTLYLVIP